MDPLPSPDHSFYLQIIGFVIALLAIATFSFLETCITALRLFSVKEMAEKTKRYTYLLQTLEKNPHRILITVLIASSLANTTCAALITRIMEDVFTKLHFSTSIGFSLGVGIASASILIFGEIIPKNFAKLHGEKIFHSMLWFLNVVFYLLYPFVTLLVKLSSIIIYYTSGKTIQESAEEAVTSEKEIEFLIDYIDEKGLMESQKIDMLQSIFSLNETPVKEIMVPTTDVVSISINSSLRDALEAFSQYHFSRLPVYENKHDNIIGMIYLKDVFLLLSKNEEKPLKELVRPVLYIPESVKVNQLLREFKQQHMHLAMVINEYGGIAGLVTLEDVLEEIVGEITDEYEAVPEKIIPLKQGGWLVDGGIALEELTELLHITFEVEDAITLGGFLTEQLQHLPRKGERVLYKSYCFQVQHASPKRVHEVLIFEEKKLSEVPIKV
jgi:putative hemolysin